MIFIWNRPSEDKMSQPPTYITYLLRLWQAEIRTEPVWHASLEDPRTGERKGFADLKSLCAFLEAEVADYARRSSSAGP
jgi:hypothetical protein